MSLSFFQPTSFTFSPFLPFRSLVFLNVYFFYILHITPLRLLHFFYPFPLSHLLSSYLIHCSLFTLLRFTQFLIFLLFFPFNFLRFSPYFLCILKPQVAFYRSLPSTPTHQSISCSPSSLIPPSFLLLIPPLFSPPPTSSIVFLHFFPIIFPSSSPPLMLYISPVILTLYYFNLESYLSASPSLFMWIYFSRVALFPFSFSLFISSAPSYTLPLSVCVFVYVLLIVFLFDYLFTFVFLSVFVCLCPSLLSPNRLSNAQFLSILTYFSSPVSVFRGLPKYLLSQNGLLSHSLPRPPFPSYFFV